MRNLCFLVVMVLLLISPVAAQVCEDVFDTALTTSLAMCEAVGRDQACHGTEQVEVAFNQLAPSSVIFDNPSDVADVQYLAAIRTADPQPDDDAMGVAVLRVGAMLPQTLPGQAVIILLTGNAGIENDVPPETAVFPAQPIPVTVAYGANLRSAPTQTAAVMEGAAQGETLQIDGRDSSGEWLRVVDDVSRYWIFRGALADAPAVDELPDVSAIRGPMQAFYIQPGVGAAACANVPDAMLIQTPRNVPDVTLQVNGAQVTLGSTVLIEQDPTNNRLNLSVFDGFARVSGGLTVFAGQTVDGVLDATDTVQSWERIRPISEAQRERYAAYATASESDVFHYAFTIPQSTPQQAASGGGASGLCVDSNGNIQGAGGVVQFGGGQQLAVNDAGEIVPAGSGVFGPYCRDGAGGSGGFGGSDAGGGSSADGDDSDDDDSDDDDSDDDDSDDDDSGEGEED